MELRNVVIVANIWKDESHKVADEIKGYLEKHGIAADILLTENLDEEFDISIKTDLLVSVGGDGTVLFCARLVENLGIPILAVNLGTFGYITEISSTEWKQAIDDLLNGEEKISRRLMLKVSVHRDGRRIFQCQGLNEAVVTSAGVAKVVNLDLFIGRTKAGTFRSDGIIIATPTGSTAYNISAGGSIVYPLCQNILLTPVAAHTLTQRPMVLDSSFTLGFCVSSPATLLIDGQEQVSLDQTSILTIRQASQKATLIQPKNRCYFQVLKEKFQWGQSLLTQPPKTSPGES